MSEQHSPAKLLEGLLLGEPISSHHGVRCCPAISADGNNRYMVKIISIPAAENQLDALLLTGACTDETQALSYFKDLADGVADEAKVLRRLSGLDGFDAHLEYEIRQMDHGVGYEVYLLSKYKRSLATLMHQQPLTHLAAVNLGLDICAALTACRRLGYLYVNLKPENIFFTQNHGYRIGDLGFISLASGPYASLPEKYRSRYTAPEIHDVMSNLNGTMDIYALGLILYQVYNNGQFPFEGSAPAKELPTPLYADYEMAEIILKACAPDPSDRWQDPAQMGQALVDYMQRNSVNDAPIIPGPVVIHEKADVEEPFLSEEENDARLAPLLAALPEEIVPEQLAMDGSTQSLISEPIEPKKTETTVPAKDDENQLSFLDRLTNDETAPSQAASEALAYTQVTKEVAQMLSLADDLIAHELPEPVVAPGPIDVPIPPMAMDEPEEELPEDPDDVLPPETEVPQSDTEEAVPYDTEDAYLYDLPVKRKPKRWIALLSVALLLLAVAIGGYVWCQEVFLQPIEALTVQGDGYTLTVTVASDVNENLLSVVCTDTYGNTLRAPVVGGTADFSGLTPATQYRIRLEISGLHKLTGKTTAIYTTEPQTEILNFSAVLGPEDGSAILSFSVGGPDMNLWTLRICAQGEETRTQEFSGHSVTIFGLTPNKRYTFYLESHEDRPLAGQTEIGFTARSILRAQDLQIIDCGNSALTVQWAQPNAPIGQVWILRCYNGAGYDKTITTTNLTYTFTGLNHSTGYTVVVTAEGMSQSVSASVTANPIHIINYTVTQITTYALNVQWDFTGAAPDNGWILTYQVDGNECSINCPENNTILTLVNGGNYEFTVKPADGTTCFTYSSSYAADEGQRFEDFGITAENIAAALVKRPEGKTWGYADLNDKSYKTAFAAGEQAGIVLSVDTNFTLSTKEVTRMFIIRDSSAQLVSAMQATSSWRSLWNGSHCTLDIPRMPQEPGTYSLDLYFNDQLVTTLSFTVI